MAPLSRPFLLLAATCTFLIAALLVVWLTLLPQNLTQKIADDVNRKTGLVLTANGGSALSLQDGLAMRLNDVSVADPSRPGVPVVTASHMRVGISLARLFGGAVPADDVTLEDPVFTLSMGAMPEAADVAKTDPSADAGKDMQRPRRPATLTISNGTLRVRDSKGAAVLAIADINGKASRSTEGAIDANATALINSEITTLELSIEDVRRLEGEGSPMDLSAAARSNSISYSGRVRSTKGLELDGHMLAGGDQLQAWLKWIGIDVQGFAGAGPLTLEAGLSAADGTAALSNISLKQAGMTVTGKATLRNGGPRPVLDATLTADVLDLNAYGKATAADTADVPPPSLTDPWREQPISFQDLTALDGRVEVTAHTLKAGALTVKEATLQATLDKGVMTAKLHSPEVAGGQATANLRFAVTDSQPDILLVVDSKAVNAKTFLGALTGFKAVDGPIDLHAELTARGNSEARLVASLAGEMDATLHDATVDGIALAKTLAQDGAGWVEGETTVLTSAQVKAEVADGIATLTDAQLEAAGFVVRAEGEVDVLRQAVDLRLKPRVSTGGGISLRLPVTVMVQGPWANPTVDGKASLKPKALLRELGTAVDSGDAAKAIGKKAKKTLKKLFGN